MLLSPKNSLLMSAGVTGEDRKVSSKLKVLLIEAAPFSRTSRQSTGTDEPMPCLAKNPCNLGGGGEANFWRGGEENV